MNKKWQKVLIPLVLANAGILFGFDTGNIAGALPLIRRTLQTTLFQEQFIVSITILVAFLSATLTGRMVDRFGTKKMLIVSAILYIFSALQSSFTYSLFGLIVIRSMMGLAIGISSFSAPMYIAEMTPPNQRGRYVLVNGIAITFGELLAFSWSYFLADRETWQETFLLSILPALLLLLGMLGLPSGKQQILGSPFERSFPGFFQKLKFLKLLFSKNEFKYPLTIGILLGVFQQFFGINSIMYYGPIIFEEMGMGLYKQQLIATMMMGGTNFIGTLIAVCLIDSVGRRKLLLIGSMISTISLLTLGLLIQMKISIFLSLVVMMLYIFGYCISVGSLFWLVISEIFPSSIRGFSMGIATGCQWLSNFLNSSIFLSAVNILSLQGVFLGYASVCVLCFLFVHAFIPETKGIALAELETFWKNVSQKGREKNQAKSPNVR